MNHDAAIEEVLSRFDFDEVHEAMVKLDWTWHSEEESPTTYELIKSARVHFQRCVEGITKSKTPHYICSSGGLKAYIEAPSDDSPEWYYRLEFVVTEADYEVAK